MRRILSARYLPILKEFSSSKTLLAFDFDGTLAPIVSEPGRAKFRRITRELLRELASLYPCIVVSGRSRADVLSRVSGIAFRQVIGNHGIEPWESTDEIARAVSSWSAFLAKSLDSFPGVYLEDKGFSLSIHYRKEKRKREVIKAIENIAERIPGARIVTGKQVINIVPIGLADKGLALRREIARRRCKRAIYVGDDKTDESVFALSRRGRLLTIRVGPKRSSLACFCIRNQREIDELLRSLIAFRTLIPNSQLSKRS